MAFELNGLKVNPFPSQLKLRDHGVALASLDNHTHTRLLKKPELIVSR